ncbi:protein SSUH2 homolog isoform X2 [Grus americana]|uniref:protein SSUH2 homolog isoform X2 n=1 Tax=Grus americana TaxID=9117 RepID=UPI00240832DD|nr:protein SSUH2 homolog isoform X2 [Grus americana]
MFGARQAADAGVALAAGADPSCSLSKICLGFKLGLNSSSALSRRSKAPATTFGPGGRARGAEEQGSLRAAQRAPDDRGGGQASPPALRGLPMLLREQSRRRAGHPAAAAAGDVPKPGAARPPRDASPDPWDMEVGAPLLFQGQTRRCRVPRSALVRDCHRCHGHGRAKCGVCHGAGRTRCVTCKGSRRRLKQQKRCQLCSGTGRKRCNTCSGRGSKTCATCHGEKKLQHFKQLVITWKNNVFEFVSEHHLNFPGELLSKVSGENIFKDENVMVYPIIDFPDPEISLASQRAIAEHSAAFATSSRILRQRQTIELIPITEVHYQYSGKPYLYYIYGLENKVYALDYPERCCCGCTIV